VPIARAGCGCGPLSALAQTGNTAPTPPLPQSTHAFLRLSLVEKELRRTTVTTVPVIDTPASSADRRSPSAVPVAPFAMLALTAAICLVWSAVKLLWWDEFLVLWTDHQPSWTRIIHIQASYPISLDPLLYHLLAHTSMWIFGADAFAIRLPSLIGFLVMQFCLWYFVRRIASERAALFALLFPALTATLYYAVEGRPYGLLLGLCGVAMVSWQTAIRRETNRTLPLVCLALSIGAAFNTHYFAVLLLAPFFAAEYARAIQRRRLDFPLLAAIGAGSAALVLIVPFAKAAAVFRQHDYFLAQNRMTPDVIATAYTEIFLGKAHTFANRPVVLLLIAVFFAFTALAVVRQVRARRISFPQPEFVFVVVLALLPVFGFLLAFAITHVFEPRHMIATIMGVSVLLAVSLDPLLGNPRVGRLLMLVLMAELGIVGLMHIRVESQQTAADRAALPFTAAQKAAILASPTGKIYMQEPAAFSKAWYYQPDSELRSRLVFVYSREQELRSSHMDVVSLTEIHLARFTDVPVESWESLRAEPGEHVLVTYPNNEWDWLPQALGEEHATVMPLGAAFHGDAVSVRFR
jgi:hypothetical protein